MCENCGYDNAMIKPWLKKRTIVLFNCSRCGQKLSKPVTLGSQQEQSQDPPIERKTLID